MFTSRKGPIHFRYFPSYCVQTLPLPINDYYALALPRLIKRKLYDTFDDFSLNVIHIFTPSPLVFLL